jgi:uncharacterized protein with NRDE domain
MCTVSYIPTNSGFLLTSNRDEQQCRATIAPQQYVINGQELIFPKDSLAGGTWIAASQKNRFACLLNGAFEKHKRKAKYDKSRGKVLLESFDYSSLDDFISLVELSNVEPFTLLLIDNDFLELRWDGEKKHLKEINRNEPQLWQSATLYDKSTQIERHSWFKKWIEQNCNSEDKNIFNFHQSKHSDNIENDIIMSRPHGLKTVSISQIKFAAAEFDFRYFDSITGEQTHLTSNHL